MKTSRVLPERTGGIALSAIVLVLSCITLLMASCQPELAPQDHNHTISVAWSYDENYHWHAASCGDSTHNEGKASHAWGLGEVITPATPSEDGEMRFTCTVCGKTRTEVIPVDHAHEYHDYWMYRQVAGDVEKFKACKLCTNEISEDAEYTDIFTVEEGALSCVDDNTELLSGAWTIPTSVGGSDVTSIAVSAFSYADSLTALVIPESIVSIGDYALNSCTALESLSLPASLTTLGRDVFLRCANLSTILVSPSNPNYSAEDGILYNKDKTELIAYPSASGAISIRSGVTKVASSAFYECSEVTSLVIPDSVTWIDQSCFYGCDGITSVVIPDSVTKIGWYAFRDCSNLTEITVGINAARFEGTNIFQNTPARIVFKSGRTTIPGGFLNNGNLITEVSIPNTVTTICDSALFGCSSLTEITIPDSVTTIENNAFRNCSGLRTITIPSGVTSIGAASFMGCTCDVVFAPGRVTIPSTALYGANSVTHVTIPAGVTTISNAAFYNCTSLEQITFGGTKAEWGAITKLYDWKTNVPTSCVVKCSDGEVAI